MLIVNSISYEALDIPRDLDIEVKGIVDPGNIRQAVSCLLEAMFVKLKDKEVVIVGFPKLGKKALIITRVDRIVTKAGVDMNTLVDALMKLYTAKEKAMREAVENFKDSRSRLKKHIEASNGHGSRMEAIGQELLDR